MNTTFRWTVLFLPVFCVSALSGSTTHAQGVSDLENYYTFDDEANLGIDSSGNGRDAEVDDLEVLWLLDDERGGVVELGGGNNGFLRAEIPELPSDSFTIAFWAYRDPELCCDAAAGGNDGFFHVTLDADVPGGPATKTIGAWVQKNNAGVWGRVIQEDGSVVNLDSGTFIMEDEVWTHFAYRGSGDEYEILIDGEPGSGPVTFYDGSLAEHNTIFIGKQGTETWGGRLDDFRVYSRALTDDEIVIVMEGDSDVIVLRAGDADQDLKFDQIDLVKVQIAAKYLTGAAATWGEGDWDGAPGGEVGAPPPGDGRFDQLDIIAALNANTYLMGPYAALAGTGTANDGQTSIIYDAGTGEVAVDAPSGTELTSVNIDSASGIFTGDAAMNLGGSFDNDADNNIFKATFGSSFGSLSFGNVAQAGLSEESVLNDLTVIGSLAGGGDLGAVDLIYVPEPSAIALFALGLMSVVAIRRRSTT